MYSTEKWISRVLTAGFVILIVSFPAAAQIHIWMHPQMFVAPDAARDLFNEGQRLFDESRFGDAESKFREVVRRFPKNAIADRAGYYLIRTLAQDGKKSEALNRIDAFAKQYPKSRWLGDVQELRIQLTNQIPPAAETILLRPVSQTQSTAPPAPTPFRSPTPIKGIPPGAAAPSGPPVVVKVSPFSFQFETQHLDPDVSLQQEIMRAMFRNNVDRAIEIATERLKADPADPVVLSSLHAAASTRSAQAMSMLLGIVQSSPNPKARRDAIFWLGQSRNDSDTTVDTLLNLLPSLNDEDSEAVAYTLSRISSEKSGNALAAIARDRNKSEKTRTNAIFWIGQSRVANRISLLEDIYKNSTDNPKIRQQVMFALSRTGDPQAVTVMSNAASADPDIDVRRQAVYWLGQNRSPEASQALENLLRKK